MEKADKVIWNNTWKRQNGNIAISDMDRLIFRELIKFINIKGKEIIELGCGRGILSFFMLKNGAKSATLVDFSQEALNLVRDIFAGVNNVEFVKSDILELNEDKTYDIVFSSGVAEPFSTHLRENIIYKHLKLTKDIAILIVPSRPHFNTIRHKKRRVIALYGWQYAFSKSEIRDIINKFDDYTIVHLRRFFPLYGINFFELFGIDSEFKLFRLWNPTLKLVDSILNKVRFYKFVSIFFSTFSNRLGGLLIVVIKKKI